MKVHLFGRTFRLLRRLKSRKNRVYLVEDDAQRYVLKLYRSPHHLRSSREHRVLQQAYHCGLAVPRPLAFIERKALLMAHVPGENLCDLLNRRLLPVYADQLGGWYAAFHRCFGRPDGSTIIRGDSNLRNFVLGPHGTLHGVDFEEAAPGDPLRDLGQICASILDTEPLFTPAKTALCRRLIASYGRLTGRGNLEGRLTTFITAALRETAGRRPAQRAYLLEQSNRLEKQGLASL